MKYIFIIITVLALGFFISCHRANGKPDQPTDPIKDNKPLTVENFRLSINTMMAYDFVYAGHKTDTGFYLEYFLSNRHWDNSICDYVENKNIVHAIDGDQAFYEEICQLFTECRVDKWDGFSGSNPPDVLDGSMMGFNATLCDGTTIQAHGSNNFPKNYGALESRLHVMSTCERITSTNFETDLFSVTLPEKWVNLVTAQYNECYIAFSVPQSDGKATTMLLIDKNTYDYYESRNESSVNIGKLMNPNDAETTYYIDFRDYYGFKSNVEKLTEEAKAIADTYEADKQAIIESFKPAEGYNFIKEE